MAAEAALACPLLIVSGPADPVPHRNAISAAKAAGAQHIVYTSHMAASPRSLFSPATAHAETEHDLQQSGVPFTSLRDGFHASSALYMLGRGLHTGQVQLPADGPTAWTAQVDLAEAAVVALTDGDRLHGITPPLTGVEALDLAGVVQIVSELTGRPITRTTVSDQEYVNGLLETGMPRPVADMFLGYFAASRRGEFATVDPTLGQLLGGAPTRLREVLAPMVDDMHAPHAGTTS